MALEVMTHPATGITAEQVDLIKRTVCKDLTNDELAMVLHQQSRTGLDILTRQLYAFKSGGKVSIGATIDGMRLVAVRSGKYAGQVGPFWCGPDGAWSDVWLKKEPPAAAKVGVLHADFKEPMWAVARLDSYKGGTPIWGRMPDVMLAKCAESLALRKAFPHELSGIYSDDEMDQAREHAPAPAASSQAAERWESEGQPTQAPTPAQRSTSDDWKPSEAQLKRLYAIAKKHGITGKDDLRVLLDSIEGYPEKEGQLNRDQYDQLTNVILPELGKGRAPGSTDEAIEAEILLIPEHEMPDVEGGL